MSNAAIRIEEQGSYPDYTPIRNWKRILIVEDDLDLVDVLERVLRSIDRDVEIDVATSAETALFRLNERARSADEQRPYDLLIADIFLEGRTTGLDVWKICQNVYPEIHLIVTSSLPIDKFLAATGRESAAPPFLAKPFTVMEVKKLFSRILRPEDGAA